MQNQQNFNPAEFALDLVSVDYSSPESEEESRARVHKLLAAHRSVNQSVSQWAGCGCVSVGVFTCRGIEWIIWCDCAHAFTPHITYTTPATAPRSPASSLPSKSAARASPPSPPSSSW